MPIPCEQHPRPGFRRCRGACPAARNSSSGCCDFGRKPPPATINWSLSRAVVVVLVPFYLPNPARFQALSNPPGQLSTELLCGRTSTTFRRSSYSVHIPPRVIGRLFPTASPPLFSVAFFVAPPLGAFALLAVSHQCNASLFPNVRLACLYRCFVRTLLLLFSASTAVKTMLLGAPNGTAAAAAAAAVDDLAHQGDGRQPLRW